MRVSWLQRCSHCWRGILNLDIYDNLCFSYYWVFCHHCLLKGTDPHSVLPEESSLSGLIGLSSSLAVISLGSRAMFLKVLTADHPHNDHLGTHKNAYSWASLVAQWLRVCLPVQGTRVRALVWEDPTCRGATRPVSHNY